MSKKEKNTIYYRVPRVCEESYYELKTVFDIREDDKWIAQDAADDYHANHDGWESSWPLEFSLHDYEEGPEVCRFSVDREAVPEFSATRIEKE